MQNSFDNLPVAEHRLEATDRKSKTQAIKSLGLHADKKDD